MGEEEFNLSDKIAGKVLAYGQPKECAGELILYVKDVKKFIRLLKEETDKLILKNKEFRVNVAFAHQTEQIINKLAGDRLRW